MSAAAILFYSRNMFMNAHQTMTGMILKRGAAAKSVFARLYARSLCVSYKTILRKQVEFGNGHDKPVLDWKCQIEAETKRRTLPTTQPVEQTDQHPGYKLVGDNVDIFIKPRHSTISDGNKDLHYYNCMAVKNRVSGNHLEAEQPMGTVDSVPWSKYLPTAEDNEKLKNEWNYLVSKTIINYVPYFQCFKEHIPDHLSHKYINLTKKKTEVVTISLRLFKMSLCIRYIQSNTKSRFIPQYFSVTSIYICTLNLGCINFFYHVHKHTTYVGESTTHQ